MDHDLSGRVDARSHLEKSQGWRSDAPSHPLGLSWGYHRRWRVSSYGRKLTGDERYLNFIMRVIVKGAIKHLINESIEYLFIAI